LPSRKSPSAAATSLASAGRPSATSVTQRAAVRPGCFGKTSGLRTLTDDLMLRPGPLALLRASRAGVERRRRSRARAIRTRAATPPFAAGRRHTKTSLRAPGPRRPRRPPPWTSRRPRAVRLRPRPRPRPPRTRGRGTRIPARNRRVRRASNP